jgi:hypothetical protein
MLTGLQEKQLRVEYNTEKNILDFSAPINDNIARFVIRRKKGYRKDRVEKRVAIINEND